MTQLRCTMEMAARLMVGEDAVFATEQSWGGDSFAWYLEEVRGAYARLGTHNPVTMGPQARSARIDLRRR